MSLQLDLIEKDVAIIIGTAVKLIFTGNFTPREHVPLKPVGWHAVTWVQRALDVFLRLTKHLVLVSCPWLKPT